MNTMKVQAEAERWRQEGAEAFVMGYRLEDCPYRAAAQVAQRTYWIKGWESAKYQKSIKGA